jgi:hypothetical protein
VFKDVSLVAHYHEEGETEEAFLTLLSEAESLTEEAGRVGLDDRASAQLVFKLIEEEIGLMYDLQTADRLMQAFRQCFDRSSLRGSR